MCAKKTTKTSKKSHQSFFTGMDEMMNNFCSGGEWTADCCSRFLRMSRSSTNGADDFMTMCEQMRKTICS